MCCTQFILNWLREKATQQYFIAKAGGAQPGSSARDPQDDDVLAIFGGHTRVHQVDSKSQSRASPQVYNCDSPSPQSHPMNDVYPVHHMHYNSSSGSSATLRSSSRTHSDADAGLFGDELEPSPFAPTHASTSSPPIETVDWPNLSVSAQEMNWIGFDPSLQFEPMQGPNTGAEGMDYPTSNMVGQQWISFMQDSGILAGDLEFSGNVGGFATSL
jgi:hypothetical protein